MDGVGIDLEQVAALARYDEEMIGRAAARWLGERERAWCGAQPSFRDAMLSVLVVKEAVFKATANSGPVHEVRLALLGDPESGLAVSARGSVRVDAVWYRIGGSIVAVAVVGRKAARVLAELLTSGSVLVPGVTKQSAGRARMRGSGTEPRSMQWRTGKTGACALSV